MVYQNENKQKSESGLDQDLLFVEAGAEELCPLVEGGQVRQGPRPSFIKKVKVLRRQCCLGQVVLRVIFFGNAQPTCFRAWFVDVGSGQELPLDFCLQPFILQAPYNIHISII